MTKEETLIAAVEAAIAEYRKPAEPVEPPSVVVPTGGDVQAAIVGSPAAVVELEAGGSYAGFSIHRPVLLRAHGARIHGNGKPAIHVPPGVSDVTVLDAVCSADYPGAVVQLGNNDSSQTDVAQVPRAITLSRVRVPTHRGKRGFEINSTETLLLDCEARDIHTLDTKDSSAIGILNTPGGIRVRGGLYEGGSECVLVGGDVLKLAGVVAITGLLFEDLTLSRPLSWQTDGVVRIVKNIFELKNGRDVVLRRAVLDGSWRDGQDGYAIMLTPTRGGEVVNVLMEQLTVRNVGGGLNITGADSSGTNLTRTTGLVLRDSTFEISKALFGGTGRFVTITSGPNGAALGTLDVERTDVTHDASSVVYQAGPRIDRFTWKDSRWNAGQYGLNFAGGANLSNQAAGVATLEVTGNTISGAASALKSKLPANTFV